MKHRVLLEFSADTLPDDFLDQIAGRVYGHPAVEKKECTATLLNPDKILDYANNYEFLLKNNHRFSWNPSRFNEKIVSGFAFNGTGYLGFNFQDAINAAKYTQ